jgi:hypothetical protein
LAAAGFVALMLAGTYVALTRRKVSPLPAANPVASTAPARAAEPGPAAPDSTRIETGEKGASEVQPPAWPKTIRLVVTGDTTTPSGNPLLFDGMAREILRACGIEPVAAEAPEATPVLRLSVAGVGASGEVEGEIVLERPGKERLASSFRGELPEVSRQAPTRDRRVTVDDLVDSLAAPDSFATRVFELLGRAYGFGPLVAAVTAPTTFPQPEPEAMKLSAIEALAKLDDERAVDALLYAYECIVAGRWDGDAAATHRALVQLTRRDFGTDVGQWHAWRERTRAAAAAADRTASGQPASIPRTLPYASIIFWAVILLAGAGFFIWRKYFRLPKEYEALFSAHRPGLGGADPVCPSCGTVYNRAVVVRLLKEQSPELFHFSRWTTKFVCKQCRAHIVISGVGGE